MVTENKIKKILEEAGIIISAGEISNILTQEKKEELTKERKEILKAGLESSSYFHIDDTGLNHEGQKLKSAYRLPSRPAQKVPHACVGIAFYDLLDRFRKNPDEEDKGKLETESGIHFQENVP